MLVQCIDIAQETRKSENGLRETFQVSSERSQRTFAARLDLSTPSLNANYCESQLERFCKLSYFISRSTTIRDRNVANF
jgi:hypothetical protein